MGVYLTSPNSRTSRSSVINMVEGPKKVPLTLNRGILSGIFWIFGAMLDLIYYPLVISEGIVATPLILGLIVFRSRR